MSNRRKPAQQKAAKKVHVPAAETDRVVIGYCHPGEVSGYFCQSLVNMLVYDRATEGRIVGCINEWSSANVSSARNRICRSFLDYDAEWLLFIDSDMLFPHEAIERLIESADVDERPIVGGLCFGIDRGVLFPTIYVFHDTEKGPTTARVPAYPENSIIPVAATGAAFLMIHRRVLEAFLERGFNESFPWFQESELAGQAAGEDITFCLRAGVLGFPVHVDTGLHIGHHKSQVLTHDMFMAQQQRMAAEHAAKIPDEEAEDGD